MGKNKYILLDSGDYEKLEIVGPYKIIRPSLHSAYKKNNEKLWTDVAAYYKKNDKGSGEWEYYQKIPESFSIDLDQGLKAKIKLTPFGHLGIFPEQKQNWNLLLDMPNYIHPSELNVLNLFAYSGISTLYCLKAGMNVCHVDSSKGMVEWARENTNLSGLGEQNVRWIVDDVIKFLKREIKRNKTYNGFILDPPSFGRGAKGEIWKIEEDLPVLIEILMELCQGKPEFVFLSCHTAGFSPLVLERILKSNVRQKEGITLSKELSIQESTGDKLASGFCAYYFSPGLADLSSQI